MAITEVLCINSDKDFKVTDNGFALTQIYKIHFSLNWENQTKIGVCHIYRHKRPLPEQCKSLFHSLFLNSQISFTDAIWIISLM